MSGLIVKDLCVLRWTAKSYLVVIALYALFAFSGVWTAEIFSGVLAVLVTLLPANAFSWDNYVKWDSYCLALPVSRRRVVAARYVVTLLAAAAACLLGGALGVALQLLGRVEDLGVYLLSTGAATGAGCLMVAVILPLMYKVGPEKGRVALLAVIAIPFAAFLVLLQTEALTGLMLLPAPAPWVLSALPFLLLAALAAVMGISFLISCRIYEKKQV